MGQTAIAGIQSHMNLDVVVIQKYIKFRTQIEQQPFVQNREEFEPCTLDSSVGCSCTNKFLLFFILLFDAYSVYICISDQRYIAAV